MNTKTALQVALEKARRDRATYEELRFKTKLINSFNEPKISRQNKEELPESAQTNSSQN